MGSCGLDSTGSGYRRVGRSCKQVNEPSGSIKGGIFLDYLCDYEVLKKDSVKWS